MWLALSTVSVLLLAVLAPTTRMRAPHPPLARPVAPTPTPLQGLLLVRHALQALRQAKAPHLHQLVSFPAVLAPTTRMRAPHPPLARPVAPTPTPLQGLLLARHALQALPQAKAPPLYRLALPQPHIPVVLVNTTLMQAQLLLHAPLVAQTLTRRPVPLRAHHALQALHQAKALPLLQLVRLLGLQGVGQIIIMGQVPIAALGCHPEAACALTLTLFLGPVIQLVALAVVQMWRATHAIL